MELSIQPLEIRRMELSIREAGRILSKDVDIPIKASWENWRESEKTEKYNYVAVWQNIDVHRRY